MVTVIVLILAAVIALIAYVRGFRSSPQPQRSSAGWLGLGLLVLLFAGMWASGQAGNEAAAYGFGLAILLALAVMLIVGVASAVGRAVRKRKDSAS